MVEILYKSENAVVIYKPHGIPAQPDPSGSADAMTLTRESLAELGEDSSLWLIHRLDRGVAGVMAFARNKRAAATLSELVKERQITKEYLAVVVGTPEAGEMTDFLYKDTRLSKAFVVKSKRAGVKSASLYCAPIATVRDGEAEITLVRVSLNTGRFHQIRAQLAARTHPILGDKKYGSRIPHREGIALAAYHLNISLDGERISVTRLPDTEKYPWSLFDPAAYERLTEND